VPANRSPGLPATRKTKARYSPSFANSFTPRFWETEDSRYAVVREIRHRVQTLADDTGADSFQKRLLCQRAIFLSLQLETAEVEAIRGGVIDLGAYTQGVNCLVGLLRSLGLERRIKDVGTLRDYLGAAG
jgi:hypothetical protein